MLMSKKIKMQLSHNQKNIIDFWLRRCCLLYNTALEERIAYYKVKHKSSSLYDQKKEIVDIKNYDSSWYDIPNKALSNIIFMLDNAYKNFFRDSKKVGFPKFKSYDNFNTITLTNADVRLKSNNTILLPKIKTHIKLKEIPPKQYRQVKITRESNDYYIIFTYRADSVIKLENDLSIGIDLGLINLYADSLGNKQKRFSLKLYNNYYKRIRELNQSLANKKMRSNNWKKIKEQLNKTYKRLVNSRNDFLHKVSYKLVTFCKDLNISNIVVGDIKISNIVSKSNKGLRKSFYNVSLNTFKQMIKYKSELYGLNAYFVNEAYTSKTCSCCCKVNNKLNLSYRTYECLCGNNIDRDVNAAINIKNVWLGQFSCIHENSHI